MDVEGLFNRLARSPVAIRIATLAVILVWGTVLIVFIAASALLLEQPAHTQTANSDGLTPALLLEPPTGTPGTTVHVYGQGWQPGDTVMIYLRAPGQTELPGYAIAGIVPDGEGRFTTGFVVPTGSDWEDQGLAMVVAQVAGGGASAQASFRVLSAPAQPTPTPSASVTPTPTPTEPPPTPTATSQPQSPTAIAVTDVNIRRGPGLAYQVLGVLRTGQSVQITGISADSAWWQIQFSGSLDGRGWVSAGYVIAENTENVPVVQSPPLPPTPTPTPTPTSTPVVITDWRGEYYSNPDLSGAPVLVRNDVAINFDWGTGGPASGLPGDDFSVRWSRGLNFAAGSYRFYARVDDGVRLWIDGTLLIDHWHDSSPTTYSADVYLSGGWHNLWMEYYERSGGALAQLAWERRDNYPDWKAEYYDNRKLEGNPVLVRNETEIDFNWGSGSPGAEVPADDFSARWTRKVKFESGTYIFRVRVDDGVRLWVGDAKVIDSWRDGSSRWIEAEHNINEGKHRVKVEYYERGGGARIEVDWERKQEPSNQSPQAAPGGPYTVNEGSSVVLDGSGSQDPDGSIVSYEWDFDYAGGAFTVDAVGQTAATGYSDGPSTFTVALRVTDNDGASHLATTQVQVENVAPTAEAGGPYVGQMGDLIGMAGTGTDPGSIDQAGLTYHWDFGDGTQGDGSIVSHSYDQAGNYTVTITVTDKDGAQGNDTATVQVNAINQVPTAVISGPASGQVDEILSFDASASSDSDGSIISYTWDFGDGDTASGVSVTHGYQVAGSYSVTLTVIDDGGLMDQAIQLIQIEELAPINQPPTAVINGPVSGQVGEVLSFDASASSDSDGSIVSYDWDLGDGSTASGMSVTHSYVLSGSYQVSLIVTDDDGMTDQATHAVQIDEPAPVNQPPTAVISGPVTGQVGEALSFDASASSDSDGSIVDYNWDFGDSDTAYGVSVTHSYVLTGSYQVSLTVTDDGGLTDEATHVVQVNE